MAACFGILPGIDSDIAIQKLFSSEAILRLILPLTALSLVISLWRVVDHRSVLVWFFAMTVMSAVRYWGLKGFWQSSESTNSWYWAHRFTVIGAIYGSLWALACWLFFVPNNATAAIFLLVLLMANFLMAIPVCAYWPPAFFAYVGPCSLIIPLRLLQEEGLFVLAVLSVLYVLIGTIMMVTFHKLFLNTVKLGHKNEDLIDKLRQEKALAEKHSRAKTYFLASASHDLRQPLHALSLQVDILKQQLDSPRQLKSLGKIEATGAALGDLMDALLDMSKLESDSVEVNVFDFDYADLLDQLQLEFSDLCSVKSLSMRVRYPPAVIRSDPLLLMRVLRNFLSNATRYTAAGGVVLGGRIRGDSVHIQVWDTGSGIPDNDQKEIFEDFKQLHNPQRDRGQGLGLGLAIVKRISTLLNHQVKLSSCVGRGSCFSIVVPLATRGGQSSAMTGLYNDQMEIPSYNLPDTVLLIDDNTEILSSTVDLFSGWGCDVIAGSSEQEALSTLRHKGCSPDVIICDYRLAQGALGTDVILNIQELYGKKIPALLITGDTSPEELDKIKTYNIPVLHKPVSPARLKLFLQRVVAQV